MKYFIGFLASVGLVVLVIFLVIRGLSGGGESTDVDRKKLVDYASSDTIVRITADGPINSEEKHRAYRITVGRDDVTIETFKGYQEQVIENQTYANTQEGYANFLRAIDLAGFSLGDTAKANDDPRGVCATGDRYILEIIKGTSEIQRFWTTSCGDGTFRGDIDRVDQLFDRQVPDYTRITRGLGI